MNTMAAREAKNRFGQLMIQAQKGPVTIEKNGRPIAVMISMEEHRRNEQLKLERLQNDLEYGMAQADQGALLDADEVFNELLQD